MSKRTIGTKIQDWLLIAILAVMWCYGMFIIMQSVIALVVPALNRGGPL